jgi:putative membrane protein
MLRGTIISIVRGFAMGAADIVPGVSGGTIALVLGVYERLIASVNAGSSALGSILKGDIPSFKRWMKTVDWAFILPLGTGILLAIVLLAHIIEDLLHSEPVLMASLFVGLVAGSILIAWRMIKAPIRNHIWIALGTGVVVFAALGLRSGTTDESVTQFTEAAMWAFFVSGAIAICAMILPGISGSFILVMLGMYGTVLGAVTARDFASLFVFAIGAVVGLALFSRVLHKALTNHHDIVIAILVGLMAGSFRVLWPWPLGVDSTDLGVPDSDVGLSVVMVIVGFATMIAIAAIARRVDDGTGADSVSDGASAGDDG